MNSTSSEDRRSSAPVGNRRQSERVGDRRRSAPVEDRRRSGPSPGPGAMPVPAGPERIAALERQVNADEAAVARTLRIAENSPCYGLADTDPAMREILEKSQKFLEVQDQNFAALRKEAEQRRSERVDETLRVFARDRR